MIEALVDAGFSVKVSCQGPEVSSQDYYRYGRRSRSPTVIAAMGPRR